jgi:hypothetical protein
MPHGDLRTRNVFENTDMMASERADISEKSDTTAADTTDGAESRPHALPCQLHAH